MMMRRLALRDRPGGKTAEARLECIGLSHSCTPVFSFRREYLPPSTRRVDTQEFEGGRGAEDIERVSRQISGRRRVQ
jgi:hypothetical protein